MADVAARDPLLQHWARDIMDAYVAFEGSVNQALEAAVDLGRQLTDAHNSMPIEQFKRLFANQKDHIEDCLPFTLQWALAMMRLAANETIQKRSAELPRSISALVAIANLNGETIEEGIESGQLTPKTSQAKATVFAIRSRETPPRRQMMPRDEALNHFYASVTGRANYLLRQRPEIRAGLIEKLKQLLDNLTAKAQPSDNA